MHGHRRQTEPSKRTERAFPFFEIFLVGTELQNKQARGIAPSCGRTCAAEEDGCGELHGEVDFLVEKLSAVLQFLVWCGRAGPERRVCISPSLLHPEPYRLLELPALLQMLVCNLADPAFVCGGFDSSYLPSSVVLRTPSPWERGENTTEDEKKLVLRGRLQQSNNGTIYEYDCCCGGRASSSHVAAL